MSISPAETECDAIIVATIQKNAREEIRFGLQTYKGHRLVSVRVWATKPDGTSVPTKSGVNVKIGQLGDVRKALDLAARAASDAGWLGAAKQEAAE